MQLNCSVAVLDMDGVILKTNFIKYRAMLSLFSEYTEFSSRISEYILAHGGVPRRDKFIEILGNILKVTPTEALIDGYLRRYASAVEHEITVAPMVEGMREFLSADGYTFYVSSSSPESEVYHQLESRNLNTYFSAIYGLQTPKAEALRQIVVANPESAVVFFGDSVGDWEAAQEAAVAFVAMINERDNFQTQSVVKLKDFTAMSQVKISIQNALQSI